ncbi:prion-like-(Q/N-rich) domain-bearing protein 25 [Microplitis mediator]|uniref:prion-like-(Q/N-rich) domain-bearing protein 25 n=1 Tax=Microplitis mediator TaxID=375433 RepID=UPI002555483C|nr:prion-like-(Q/N-rich) domain-bearing protein 25 [Microplitis mediator]
MKKKVIILLNLLLFIDLLSLAISLDNDNSNDKTENHRIYSIEDIDKNCTTDDNCSHLNNTECHMNECQCKSNYIEREGICVDPIGLICYKNYDCGGDKVACLLGTCQLIETFFSPENKKNSDLYSPKIMGDYCVNDDQCSALNNTKCTEDGCRCSGNFFEIDNKCVELNGELKCSNHDECKGKARCLFGTCQSILKFFSRKNKHRNSLYSAQNIDDNCLRENHCHNIPFTKCWHYRCICSDNYVSEGNKCLGKLNAPCRIDHDCANNDLEEVGCVLNTCQLLSEFFSPSNAPNISYYFKIKSQHFDYCRNDYDCRYLQFTECSNSRCECRENYTKKDRKCRGLLNAKCYINSDCAMDDTVCQDGTCQWSPMYYSV